MGSEHIDFVTPVLCYIAVVPYYVLTQSLSLSATIFNYRFANSTSSAPHQALFMANNDFVQTLLELMVCVCVCACVCLPESQSVTDS